MGWQYVILNNTHGEIKADPPMQLSGNTVGTILNTLGAAGWELAAVQGSQFILKRKRPGARSGRFALYQTHLPRRRLRAIALAYKAD